MDIIRQQFEPETNLWHFKIGGLAADGLYRLADLSRETTSPADWLAANQAEAQALIDAGVVNEEYNERRDLSDLGQQVAAELAYLDTIIANWGSLTAAQKDAALKRLAQENRVILRGMRFIVRRLVN